MLASARTAVEAACSTAGLTVRPPVGEFAVDTPLVACQTVSFTPGDTGDYEVTVTVLAVVPQTQPGPADTALDDHADDVLAALLTIPTATMPTGQRVTYRDLYPAYSISITITV